MIKQARSWLGFRLLHLGLRLVGPEARLLMDFVAGIGEAERLELEQTGQFDAAFAEWKRFHKEEKN